MAKENKSPVSKKVEDIKPEDKRKALETALTQIKKQFGEGAVMRLGQNNGMHVDAISTGSLSLDLALGIGGLPRGRIIEIYGPESSGKTTLALHCVAEGQKRPRRKNPPSRRRTPVRTCRQTSTSRSMTTNNEDYGHRPAPPQAFTALY